MITHIWQSTLFAGAAGLLTLLLKRNRARTRYWVWLVGLVKFLIPFGLLVSLGGHINLPRWTPKARTIMEPAISFVMGGDIGEPALTTALAAPETTNSNLPTILFSVWVCGFVGIAFCWVRRWIRVQDDVRAASPLSFEIGIPVVSSPAMCEPGVFGIFRPVLLLPEGVEQHLSNPEWKCILAHELCHVRCYDNLTAAIYMLVQAIFWFHPLVWWLGNRLVIERELACDEEVLRLGSEPKVYAEGILKVCELYLESPLACVAGVTGSNLRRRVRAIMTHRGTERMNMGKKVVLAVAGVAAFVLPILSGIMNAPAILAQSPQAKSGPMSTPKWEAVSIRPTKDCGGPVGNIVSKDGKKEGGVRAPGASPGRLNLCTTLANMIPQAYVYNATGRPRTFQHVISPVVLEGAPAWMNSETFQFNAKAEGTPNFEVLWGPMMQALLEDRFKLKIRRENREVPAYALTVAKGGLKLQPMKGKCAPAASTFPPPATGPGELDCGPQGMQRKGSNFSWGFLGEFDDFSKILDSMLDRPVVNKAGITGVFKFHLEFAPDETAPGFNMRLRVISERDSAAPSDPTGGTSIFTAMQEQLGLKLEPAKGPREFLVVEHVEQPSQN